MKLVIVGGVAGGASAAARARRIDEHAQIVVFERGEYVSFANCGLPYYIGGEIKEREKLLVSSAEKLRARFNLDVRTFTEVIAIDRARKEVEAKDLKTGRTYREPYDKLILSPGARPIRPPLPGVDLDTVVTLRNIPDTDRIKEMVESGRVKSAVVVGGGFIGLEMAENLAKRGAEVSIVEMMDQVMAPLDPEMAALVHHHLREKGVRLFCGHGASEFFKQGEKTVVKTNRGVEIPADLVLLAIGVKPEKELAEQAGLAIGERGGILVDEYLRTSDPDIFAIGDAIEVKDLVTGVNALIPLAGPANRQGRIAADNALGRAVKFRGTQGTAIVKIFDLVAAATGANEKLLSRLGRSFMSSITHSNSHAGYYPGAERVSIKLVFEPESGKILGAQVVGKEGVDKRIDVLAAAIRAGLSVFDLEELELAYAPPFGSAKDPVNIAGFVAGNILRGDLKAIHSREVAKLPREEFFFLDVRDKDELEKEGYIPGAFHIPLNELRKRLGELDRNKTALVYCAVGQRAYYACRILVQNGFNALNLSGGFFTYKQVEEDRKAREEACGVEEECGVS